jgi:glycosyltransferase involved in cell wall biosynthesis
MPHGPAYHLSPDEKPEVFWEKPDGSLVGFWSREWPDVLGSSVLSLTDRYAWETWQPDCRANRIYSQTLTTGITHALFPAREVVYRPGIRSVKGIHSEAIITRLNELEEDRVIVQLHGFRVPFYNDILRVCGSHKRGPFFIVGHGMSKAPISELLGLHRPLTYLCLMIEQIRLRRLLRHVDVISEQARSALGEIRKVFEGRIEKLTMGCDFGFWIPVPSADIKTSIRYRLNITSKKKVFLATGNFIPRKKLDRLIELFLKIKHREDFFLLIAGHGDSENTRLLTSMIQPLVYDGKAILHPYVTGEALRDLYWSSDIYTLVSDDEGSSVAVMKAFACGLSVLSTPAGETAEMMERYKVGKVIPLVPDEHWEKAVIDILEKGPLFPLNVQVARHAYHWPEVAKRFLRIYDELISSPVWDKG